MGDAAVVVDVADHDAARRLAEFLAAVPGLAAGDVVPAMRSVLVVVDPGGPDPEPIGRVADAIARWSAGAGSTAARRRVVEPAAVVIPTTFDGEDLTEVASILGVPPGVVVDEVVSADLRVAVVGFSPGFAYLSGLPELLARVPRREVPRPVVPAGSVALADGWAAVYPQATPGGWRLVGRTGRRLFDPGTPPFALLRPGDRVRFRALDPGAADPDGTRSTGAGDAGSGPSAGPGGAGRAPLRPPAGATAGLVVVEPGLLTTVQDGGRRGVAHLGVPRAGPADPVSHRLANQLVGNRSDAPALEVTGRGPTLAFRAATYVAAVGGAVELSIDGRPVDAGLVVPVAAGQQLVLGLTRGGARGYLAVAGGLVVPEVMGSASTDTLSWLGPGVLRAGDELAIGRASGRPAGHLRPTGGGRPPGSGPDSGPGRYELRVLPGPDTAWFAPDLPARLRAARFVVGDMSNRVGLRLVPAGGGAGISRLAGEVASRGMVTGAVQVPPSGHPIVLGPDHATLGGYPVAAVVIAADLGLLGQCRPGDAVRLVPVEAAEARRAWQDNERALAGALVGRYPVLPA
jgi:KipI family sensor histidine kinase inhibitor